MTPTERSQTCKSMLAGGCGLLSSCPTMRTTTARKKPDSPNCYDCLDDSLRHPHEDDDSHR